MVRTGGLESSSDIEVFCRSLAIVGVAELFDKTWFMGLLLALRYRPSIVLIGSFTALFVHTILAAALGYAFAKFLSPIMLHYMTAVVFFFFAILYTWDCYQADPEADAIEAGKEEAEKDTHIATPDEDDKESVGADGKQVYARISNEDAPEENPASQANGDKTADRNDVESQVNPAKSEMSTEDSEMGHVKTGMASQWPVFWKSFIAVFIAEWGDRTQIAMIGQHASQPLIPVFLGSSVAFFLLSLSAVLAAALLSGQKIREQVVHGVSALCFFIFGVLALKDAIEATMHPDAVVS